MSDVEYARAMIEAALTRLDKVVAGLRYTNVDRETIADYTEEIINILENAHKALEDGWEV